MYFKDLVKRKNFLGISPLVSNKMTDTLYSVMKSMIVSECFCVWHVCKVLPAKKLTHKKLINLCAPLSEVHLIITTCVEETYTFIATTANTNHNTEGMVGIASSFLSEKSWLPLC